MASSEYGCEDCRSALTSRPTDNNDLFVTVHKELQGVAIARIELYQNDSVVRCTRCGAHYLCQFWEYDTEETKLEEWGVVERKAVPLPPEHLSELEGALRAGKPLPHDHFLKRWN